MATPSKTNNGRTKANTAKARARSAGATIPTDHQTASNDVTADVVEFEYDGHVYQVDTDKFDDLDIIDTLSVSMGRGLRMLLGADEYSRLRENFKASDEQGVFRFSKAQDFFNRMQEAVGPLV
ncbi:hypothetical protein VVR12_03330 [Rothia sp. LK2588]|uniref:hypothetical protein n=1 Tax=Rothia sp. LK2588 TaxID=3114369 RepID=UPI0034CFF49D